MTWMTISETARRVPTTSGRPVGTATIWRWCTKGLRGVKLEHARFGRRVAISEEALEQFAVALGQAWAEPGEGSQGKEHREGKRPAARKERDAAAAEAYLRKQGMV